jgi:hypothetical protein
MAHRQPVDLDTPDARRRERLAILAIFHGHREPDIKWMYETDALDGVVWC